MKGSETIVSISPELINTTENAIQWYTPIERNCYAKDEFLLKHFSKAQNYLRYSMMNCRYEGLAQSVLENCKCAPHFVIHDYSDFTSIGTDVPYCNGQSLICANEVTFDKENIRSAEDTTGK